MLKPRSDESRNPLVVQRYLLGRKIRYFLHLSDIEWDGSGSIFAMFVHESLEIFLPATNDNNTSAFFNNPTG